MSKRSNFAFLLIVCLLATTTVIFAQAIQPTEERALLSLTLQKNDLPDGSEWNLSGLTDSNDMAQPLATNNLTWAITEESQQLLAYDMAYKSEALVPNEQSVVYIASYLYRYADQTGATTATNILTNFLVNQYPQENLSRFDYQQEDGLQGVAFSFTGSEGDRLGWFIGHKNNVVLLLIANGPTAATTDDIFKSVLTNWLTPR